MNQRERARPTSSEMMEASAPKAPPVRMSGPLTVAWISASPASLPETAKPKMLPCVKFQAQWMPMGSQRVPEYL